VTAEQAGTADAPEPDRRSPRVRLTPTLVITGVVVLLLLVSQFIVTSNFFSRGTLSTLTPLVGILVLVATGQAFVISTGGIDLSLPATMTLMGAIVLNRLRITIALLFLSSALLVAREQYDITKHDQWYERLGRWQEALRTYERREQEDPGNPDIAIGRMKCLHALGEWDQLAGQVEEYWASATPEERREIAPMAAAAAWSLNDWDSMDNYIATMKAESTDRAFYRAILSVHQNQFPKALAHITKARDLLDPELSGLIGESYGRSYT